MLRSVLDKNTNSLDPDSWPAIDTTINVDYDLSTIAAIANIVKQQDHFYAMVRLEIAGRHDGSEYRTIQATLNASYAGRVVAKNSGTVAYNSISMPVRVLYSDYKLTLNLEADVTMQCYYRVIIDGIYI